MIDTIIEDIQNGINQTGQPSPYFSQAIRKLETLKETLNEPQN